ncbi:MAG: type II toxin-antitoxin system prevent-host-death family antitoxin [Opitutaceae bacterium]|nr:type II toxin-antitoxin system prevent-host-death family antitoxin [Opitutaceae bacterium]
MADTKIVGAYEARSTLPALLDLVARGGAVLITKHKRPVARLIPARAPVPATREVFARIRKLRARLSLPQGETTRDLVEAGRRGRI